MINKKKKTVFVISALVLLTVIFLLIFFADRKTDFYEVSESVYDNVNTGFYHQAEQGLPDLYKLIYSRQTALYFLKILYRYSNAVQDYTQLSNYSEKLSRRYSNSIEIAAVYAFALNKTENYNRAFEISSEKLPKSKYNSIYLFSTLKTDNIISDKKVFEKIKEPYRQFFDGTQYSAAAAVKAADNFSDERLVYNSAIMLMREGEPAEAYKRLSMLSENSFPEARMYISYDNKDFSTAEKYYLKLLEQFEIPPPSLMAFGADIFLKNEKPSIAQSIYKGLLSSHPDFSWIPYRNLYALNKDNSNGIRHLEEGLKYFGDQQQLILAAAWEMYITDNREKLNQYFNRLDNYDNNALTRLFELNLEMNNRSPEHVVGNYWTVYNLDPQSDDIFISFSNFLLRNNYIDQLNLLIDKHEKRNGQNIWSLSYSAIGKAINGNYLEAEEKINKALEKGSDTGLFYNKAVILALAEKYDKAVKLLEQAAIFESNSSNNRDRLAKIYFKLSETYYTMREHEKALHSIRKSLSINPNDIRSNLMLKKIREEYND